MNRTVTRRERGWVSTWLAVTSVLLMLGCGGSLRTDTPAAAWRYGGEAGPENWGQLHPRFAACTAGQAQSPIAIERALPQALPRVLPRYTSSNAVFRYDDRLLRLDVENAGAVEVARQRFTLKHVLFHSPSEHHIRGRSFPLEIQLVHEGHERTLFVISVFLDHGPDHPQLAWLWSGLPEAGARERPTKAPIDVATLLPGQWRGYRYAGSLTTPPCDEPVSWLVLAQPLFVSPDRLQTFMARFPPSRRPLQPTQQRPVLTDASPPQAMASPRPRRGRVL